MQQLLGAVRMPAPVLAASLAAASSPVVCHYVQACCLQCACPLCLMQSSKCQQLLHQQLAMLQPKAADALQLCHPLLDTRAASKCC